MTGRRAPWLPLVLVLVACAGPGTGDATAEPSAVATAASPAATDPPPTPGSTASDAPSASPSPPAALSASWTLVGAAERSPAPREDHSWTVDEAGTIAYLFGGRDGGTVFGDLWAYDLAAGGWTEVAVAGPQPPARFGHSAAWVDGIGLVIFAGQAGATFFNDLWAFDPASTAWRELPAAGDVPGVRYGSCAAVAPDGRLWISHGFTSDGTRFSDTRTYDFAAEAWTDVTPESQRPVARCLHGCFWSPASGEPAFVLYGGQTTDVPALGDLWALDPAAGAWRQIGGALPADRNLYAFAARDADVVVFGGQTHGGAFLADLFRFDASLTAHAVEAPAGSPPGRRGAQLIDDAARSRLLLFGGVGQDGALGDLWQLTLGE